MNDSIMFNMNYAAWTRQRPQRGLSRETIYTTPRQSARQVDFGIGTWGANEYPHVRFQVIWLEDAKELVAVDTSDPEWKFRRFVELGVFNTEAEVRALVKPMLDAVADTAELANLNTLWVECYKRSPIIAAV